MPNIQSVTFTAELRVKGAAHLTSTVPQLILTDTTDYASQGVVIGDGPAGVISATGPAGQFYNNTNFGSADIPAPLSAPLSTIVIPLPLDQNNDLLKGSYSITYTVRLIGGDMTEATLTKNVTINYDSPTANVVMSVDLGAPLLTSDDQTDYTQDLIQPTIIRDHDLFYPASLNIDPIEGTAKIVTTNTIFTVADQTLAYTSTLLSDTSYDYTDGITLTDQVGGNGQIDIVGNADICQLYCCLNAAYDRYLKQSSSDTRRAIETRDQLEEAVSITFLLDIAIRCGKTEDIAGYVDQIKRVLDCNDDCDCGDEPQLVVGISSSGGTVTVVAGSGITVTSVSGGGTIEYTVSFDAVLLSKLNGLFNTTLLAGTNITITESVNEVGDIVYTINASDQLQSAPDVPIDPIAGQSWDDVQEALVGIKGIADTNTTSIANLAAASISVAAIAGITGTDVQAVLAELKGLIDGNTSTIDALTASDIDTSPIAGVTGAEVQTMLSSLKTLIDNTVSNTSTNTTNISTNASNISDNATDIGNNTTAIAGLAVPSWVAVQGGVGFNDTWNNDPNASFEIAQYRVDRGALQITGGFRNSGTPASDLIFSLPEGFRPSVTTYGTLYLESGTGSPAIIGLRINSTNGNVTYVGAVGANAQGFFSVVVKFS